MDKKLNEDAHCMKPINRNIFCLSVVYNYF